MQIDENNQNLIKESFFDDICIYEDLKYIELIILFYIFTLINNKYNNNNKFLYSKKSQNSFWVNAIEF